MTSATPGTLRWAKHHFEALRSQIEPFEQRDTHSIRVEVDPQTGKYEFYVMGIEPTDPDWGLVIGDCLHNARTALNYAMVSLWALITHQDPAGVVGVEFPIYNNIEEFASALPSTVSNLRSAATSHESRRCSRSMRSTLRSGAIRSTSCPPPFRMHSTDCRCSKPPTSTAFCKRHGLGRVSAAGNNIGADAPEGFESIGGSTEMDELVDNSRSATGPLLYRSPVIGSPLRCR